MPVLRQRTAGRRGASRRRHEGPRSRGGARQPDAAARRRRNRPALDALRQQPKRTSSRRRGRQTRIAEPRRCRRPTSRRRVAGHRQGGLARAPDPRRPTSRSPRSMPTQCFFVSCDLNPSTKLGKAAALVPAGHHFEMSIQEQAATLMTDGLSFSAAGRSSTCSRRSPRSSKASRAKASRCGATSATSTGSNEGLNVLMHLVARRRLHRPRSFLGLEPRLDQPGARLPAVPAPLLRAGRRALGVHRRPRCRRATTAATSSRFRATTCRC